MTGNGNNQKTRGTSNTAPNTTRHKQLSDKKVRMLYYGGARKIGDNGAFYYAAKNVEKDYKTRYPKDIYICKFIDSAKTIVDTINNQAKNSIASLDLFFHGSKWGLYIYKGSSMNKELSKEDISNKNLNAGLYGSWTTGLSSSDDHEERRNIYAIEFDRFIAKGAIIEIHGCESGGDLYVIDSISKNLSEELPEGYIIGHTTKANPNINGSKTTNAQQDYRHGNRVIWQNGTVIKSTTNKGWLNLAELLK